MRNENIAIFEDSQKMCTKNPVLRDAIVKANLQQEVILQNDPLEKNFQDKGQPAKITVSKRRTLEAAQKYKGKKVCVLNFASATNPGGGIARGSTAQEECLCRISTLYEHLTENALWDRFYGPHRKLHNPLYNDDCIYTPDVVVFKTDETNPYLLPAQRWWKVNVITCAAPNLRPDRITGKAVRISDKVLMALHIKRARRILDIAAAKGNNVVILGAFGCGAFLNPPEVVAKAMKQVVEECRNFFETIEFAVYCSSKDDTNFRVFKKAFAEGDEI